MDTDVAITEQGNIKIGKDVIHWQDEVISKYLPFI